MQQTHFPLFEQTKKGQSSLQTAAMSELLTQWLIDLKEQGLVSNDEVHQAAPEGKNLVRKAVPAGQIPDGRRVVLRESEFITHLTR